MFIPQVALSHPGVSQGPGQWQEAIDEARAWKATSSYHRSLGEAGTSDRRPLFFAKPAPAPGFLVVPAAGPYVRGDLAVSLPGLWAKPSGITLSSAHRGGSRGALPGVQRGGLSLEVGIPPLSWGTFWGAQAEPCAEKGEAGYRPDLLCPGPDLQRC